MIKYSLSLVFCVVDMLQILTLFVPVSLSLSFSVFITYIELDVLQKKTLKISSKVIFQKKTLQK